MSYFISIEGPEGSGKSTVIQALQEALSEKYEIVSTREPGGIRISEQIRDILLDDENEMDYRTEALLFAASRRQHLVEKVLPALDAGKIVLCDRFIDSSLAYQGYARNIGIDAIRQINEFAIEGKYPDLTLYLKISPETGLERIRQNSRETNRLDNEKISFHENVVKGYELLVSSGDGRYKVINADQPVENVINDCIEVVNQFLNDNMI